MTIHEAIHAFDINPSAGTDLEDYKTEFRAGADSHNVYQRIGSDLGLVFLRYGPKETFESFFKTLADAITTVSVLSDEAVTLCEEEARLFTLRQERQAIGVYRRREGKMPVHEQSPEVHTILSVVSFNHRGIPILVGYRILAQSLDSYRSVLERIVNSVQC
jgi:hypothetical protein